MIQLTDWPAQMTEDEMRETAAQAMSGLTDAEWERRQIETTNHYYGGDPSGPDRVSYTLGKNHWRRQASLALRIALPWAREKALREAADVCDAVNNHDNPMTAGDCADAILALIPVRP